MRARVSTVSAAVTVALLGLTACSSGSGGDRPARDRPTGSAAPAGQIKGQLPDVVGLDLAAATARVTGAGFDEPRPVDASGQERAPSPPEAWKVCAQSLTPGEYPTGVALDLNVLKTGEDCAKPPRATRAPATTPAPTRISVGPSPTPPKGADRPTPVRPPEPTGGIVPTDLFVFYPNCAAARAAGAAPLHRGDPGYRRGLDRDGDGVACDR